MEKYKTIYLVFQRKNYKDIAKLVLYSYILQYFQKHSYKEMIEYAVNQDLVPLVEILADVDSVEARGHIFFGFLSACKRGSIHVARCITSSLKPYSVHLYYSITSNQLEIVKLLVQEGVDPTDTTSIYCLAMAVRYGNLEMVKYLLDCGVIPKALKTRPFLRLVKNINQT